MTEKLARRPASELARFDPATAQPRDAKADAVIAYAKRVKDWPTLEQAVDIKIEDQAAFVAWWQATITPEVGKSITARLRMTQRKVQEEYGIGPMTVSRWAHRLEDRETYRGELLGAAYQEAMLTPADNHRAEGTGVEDWHTPPEYLEAARAVLGAIDLDPASSAIAQRTVKATRYFTPKDDGLTQEWPGRVWLNPPYSRDDIPKFITKLGEELDAGRTQSAIVLTHNYTDTGWFHEAERRAERLCFTRGRIAFLDARGHPAAPTQGQTFFYYGTQAEYFTTIFGAFGFVR